MYLENFVVAQAAIFLNAGFDTTGSVLAYTTYELAHYPEIQVLPILKFYISKKVFLYREASCGARDL